MVTKDYTQLNKPGVKSCRFVGVCMTFCYHQKLKVQSWKLKNCCKIIAFMIEMYTKNFAFQLFIVLRLYAREFVIVTKSNLQTNRQKNFRICITVSLHSSEILNKHILQNKATLPASIYLFKVTSEFVQR